MASYYTLKSPMIAPKEIHYHANGVGIINLKIILGRDKYIWWTNGGGFRNPPDYCKGFEIGTFGKKAPYKPINNYRPNKHVHYHADGTGRDTYVIVDEGGLAGNAYSRHNHLKSLRKTQKTLEIQVDDIFTRSQQQSIKNSNKNFSNLIGDQTKLNWKLSKPRESEDPYIHIRRNNSCLGLRKIY